MGLGDRTAGRKSSGRFLKFSRCAISKTPRPESAELTQNIRQESRRSRRLYESDVGYRSGSDRWMVPLVPGRKDIEPLPD